MSTSLILFISTAGFLQALLMAGVLFFHPKSDRSVTSFLALHILTLSIFMLMPVLQYFFSWFSLILVVPFHFLIGPFLYLYVCSFKETINLRKAWPHFLLFVLLLVSNLVVFISWLKKYPASIQPPGEVLLGWDYYLRITLRNLQMLVYYFLARSALIGYQRSIQHLFSETSKINLKWVRWLLNGYLLLVITVIIRSILVVKYPEYYNLMILINTAIITPYIYFVTIKGIGQITLWQILPDRNKKRIKEEITEAGKIELLKDNADNDQPAIKRIQDEKLAETLSRITLVMEKDKLFKEPELTLQVFADKLEIPTYLLSQAMNEGLKKNFYDLINGYRVQEAQRLLRDPNNGNYTILSVGFEAGFNSKTTFNTVFKKFTGMTPTEFRDKKQAVQVAGS